MNSWQNWFHGLGAVVISSFSTSAAGIIALPTVFNFSKAGFINMAKMSCIPALLAAFLYLKQSPLPGNLLIKTTDTTDDGKMQTKTTTEVTVPAPKTGA